MKNDITLNVRIIAVSVFIGLMAIQFNVNAQDMNDLTGEDMESLGDDFYYGRNGKEEDLEKAFKWYQLAVDAGHKSALYDVAYAYGYGEGVEKDEEKAFELFKQSAEL